MDSDESSAGIRIVSRSNDDDLYSPRLRRQSSGIDITQIPRRRRQSQNLPRHTDHNFFSNIYTIFLTKNLFSYEYINT